MLEINMDTLLALQAQLGLIDSQTSLNEDTIYLVAIDFEGQEHNPTEFGVCVRKLQRCESSNARLGPPVEFHAFITKTGKPRTPQQSYANRHKERHTRWLSHGLLGEGLAEVVCEAIRHAAGRDAGYPPVEVAHVVLVGHALSNDLQILDSSAFFALASSIHLVSFLDTQRLAQRLCYYRSELPLAGLVRALGLSKIAFSDCGLAPVQRHYHDACDDAAFTMQCLLLLTVKASIKGLVSPEPRWVQLLTAPVGSICTQIKHRLQVSGEVLQGFQQVVEEASGLGPYSENSGTIEDRRSVEMFDAIDTSVLLAIARASATRCLVDKPTDVELLQSVVALDHLARGSVGLAYSRACRAVDVLASLLPESRFSKQRARFQARENMHYC